MERLDLEQNIKLYMQECLQKQIKITRRQLRQKLERMHNINLIHQKGLIKKAVDEFLRKSQKQKIGKQQLSYHCHNSNVNDCKKNTPKKFKKPRTRKRTTRESETNLVSQEMTAKKMKMSKTQSSYPYDTQNNLIEKCERMKPIDTKRIIDDVSNLCNISNKSEKKDQMLKLQKQQDRINGMFTKKATQYILRPHIMLVDKKHEEKLILGLSSILMDNMSNRSNNRCEIHNAEYLSRSLQSIVGHYPMPWYHLPLTLNRNNCKIENLLYDSKDWIQIWLFGENQFRSGVIEEVSKLTQTMYPPLDHIRIPYPKFYQSSIQRNTVSLPHRDTLVNQKTWSHIDAYSKNPKQRMDVKIHKQSSDSNQTTDLFINDVFKFYFEGIQFQKCSFYSNPNEPNSSKKETNCPMNVVTKDGNDINNVELNDTFTLSENKESFSPTPTDESSLDESEDELLFTMQQPKKTSCNETCSFPTKDVDTPPPPMPCYHTQRSQSKYNNDDTRFSEFLNENFESPYQMGQSFSLPSPVRL